MDFNKLYTLGFIVGSPQVHTSSKTNAQYVTVIVRTFGGLNVSAFIKDMKLSDGDLVAVKRTDKNGITSYNVSALNDDAKSFIRAAYRYVGAPEDDTPTVLPEKDWEVSGMSECDTENLPF